MANSLYANTDSRVVGTGGGGIATLALGAGATTQYTSTATPCRVVYLSALGTEVHFSVSSLLVSAGALLNSAVPVMIPIDDASKIWVRSANVASVFATYLY